MTLLHINIAWRNLRQGGRRVRLLGLALTAVASLLVLLLGLSSGIHNNLVTAATTIASGHVNVAGFFKTSPNSMGIPVVNNRQELKTLVKASSPHIRNVIDRHRGWAKLISDETSIWAGLYGIDILQEDSLRAQLNSLPAQNDAERGLMGLTQRNTIALFQSQADKLKVTSGDKITVRTETMRGVSNTVDLTVVTILENMGIISSWNAFLPQQTVIELYRLKENSTGAIMVYLDDIERAEAVMLDLETTLVKNGHAVMEHDPRPFFTKFEVTAGQDWQGQRLDLTTWSDEVSFLKWILTAIDSLSLTLILIMCAIIAVGMMNTMWIAVRERTREIGTLRAVGMSRGGVLSLFMSEAILLGLVAGFIGAFTSFALAQGLNAVEIRIPSRAMQTILLNDTLCFDVTLLNCAVTAVAFGLFAGLTALFPALKAARLPPITAIQITE
ncbi:MAG: ABC transporter permease [Bradymonadia bacterium]